ncbi:MAG: hypothetical protein FRX48_07901 [Lasallia pustulata]|uniref:Uncharacterized protein n=1 Tax=Lasallia pustulata TaxID=136370 RepID=A0A5M8PFP4_9LECA|nr:MAG: hypothetical protein FRX48_07901 [Lasallia pustulata]
MASALTHFPNRSNIEFRHERYTIYPKDNQQLPPPARDWRREVASGVPSAPGDRAGPSRHSSTAFLARPSIDSELPANLAMQHESRRRKGRSLKSGPAESWRRRSSVPTAETVKVSFHIQRTLQLKSTPKLQLPSFELLGIANPHPDKLRLSRQSRASHGGQCPTDAARGDLEIESVEVVTDEHTILHWVAPINEDSSDAMSTTMATFTPTTMGLEVLEITAASSGPGEGATASETHGQGQREGTSGERSAAPQQSSHQDAEIFGSESGQSWLEQAVAVALSTIQTAGTPGDAVKFLSHAMPSPASGTNESSATAFLAIISALQEKVYSGHVQYISITHAVPLRFNLADLPTSPPSTPNPTVPGGSDYFSVFANAVAVIDRHGQAAFNTPMPSSPCPVVPPASVEISLLERYIPPSTIQEYLDLFSATDPSALVDRLVELRPNGGTLVFIYPTRAGAETFANNYLGPILDPLLRTLVVLHKLSADIGIDIGKMATVEHLATFESTKRKLNSLFSKLNRGSSLQTTASEKKMSYSLLHSCKGKVQMDRKVWAEWWAQQEIPRVREVMARYWKRAQHLPADADVTSAVLVREIANGVASRPYSKGAAPTEGIEVGVFVIRRTA